jgi:hypothetical protein
MSRVRKGDIVDSQKTIAIVSPVHSSPLTQLNFLGTAFHVPKLSLFNLFEHQPDLFQATSYHVQAFVPVESLQLFLKALETD